MTPIGAWHGRARRECERWILESAACVLCFVATACAGPDSVAIGAPQAAVEHDAPAKLDVSTPGDDETATEPHADDAWRGRRFRATDRHVYAVDFDGTNAVPGTLRRLTPLDSHFYQPDLHPTRDLIAVAGIRPGDATFNVFVGVPDGSELERITDDLELAVQPAWVPGTENIVYVSSRSTDQSLGWTPLTAKVNLWITDARGSFHRQLTFGDHTDLRPCVSPDGRTVAFLSRRGGSAEVWLLNLETLSLEPIAAGSNRPSFSPDGDTLVFGRHAKNSATGNGMTALRIRSLEEGTERGALGEPSFATMKGPTFVGQHGVLFHATKRRGPRSNGFALFSWNTVSGRTRPVDTDAIERAAHATVGNSGTTLAFDAQEVWPQ